MREFKRFQSKILTAIYCKFFSTRVENFKVKNFGYILDSDSEFQNQTLHNCSQTQFANKNSK